MDAGGAANNGWSADSGFTGGWSYSVNQSIKISGASNPAPVPIYQTEHAGMSQHLTTGLQAGRTYKLRLHFAEIWWTQPGARKFNVSANGSQILTNFDIVAAAGGPNTAVIREATVAADSQGRIRLDFTHLVDQASIAGIELSTG